MDTFVYSCFLQFSLGTGMKGHRARTVISVMLAALLLAGLASRSKALRENVSRRDSIAYWAAGRLLLGRDNPYDPDKVQALERAEGYGQSKPLVVRTPPWSLFTTILPGLTSAFWAWVIWIIGSVAALVVSTRLCWRIYNVVGEERRNLLALVAYLFAPVPACLVSGQMGLLLLLGIVLFLYFEASNPAWAGAALLFPFAKPHLLAAFWLILLVYVIHRRKIAIAAGFAAALLASIILALIFDHSVFRDYRAMVAQAAIAHEFIPALSGVIRGLFFHSYFWVQFVPCFLGLIWSLYYFARNKAEWKWVEHGPAVMVVAALTTPYSWLSDEVVLIPAMIQAAIWIFDKPAVRTRVAIGILAAMNGLLLLILSFKIPFSTGIYFWSSMVWAGWYAYGWRKRLNSRDLLNENFASQ
jgi:hypothetical protein